MYGDREIWLAVELSATDPEKLKRAEQMIFDVLHDLPLPDPRCVFMWELCPILSKCFLFACSYVIASLRWFCPIQRLMHRHLLFGMIDCHFRAVERMYTLCVYVGCGGRVPTVSHSTDLSWLSIGILGCLDSIRVHSHEKIPRCLLPSSRRLCWKRSHGCLQVGWKSDCGSLTLASLDAGLYRISFRQTN
jgi:hypothetical protein